MPLGSPAINIAATFLVCIACCAATIPRRLDEPRFHFAGQNEKIQCSVHIQCLVNESQVIGKLTDISRPPASYVNASPLLAQHLTVLSKEVIAIMELPAHYAAVDAQKFNRYEN